MDGLFCSTVQKGRLPGKKCVYLPPKALASKRLSWPFAHVALTSNADNRSLQLWT